MTDAQARTKKCPVIKVISIAIIEDITFRHIPHCIASDCMMWRQSYTSVSDGFCGLAGGTGDSPMGFPPGTLPQPPPIT